MIVSRKVKDSIYKWLPAEAATWLIKLKTQPHLLAGYIYSGCFTPLISTLCLYSEQISPQALKTQGSLDIVLLDA